MQANPCPVVQADGRGLTCSDVRLIVKQWIGIGHKRHVDIKLFVIVSFIVPSVLARSIELIRDRKNELSTTLPTLVVLQSVLFIEDCCHVPNVHHATENLNSIIPTGNGFNEFHLRAIANAAERQGIGLNAVFKL